MMFSITKRMPLWYKVLLHIIWLAYLL